MYSRRKVLADVGLEPAKRRTRPRKLRPTDGAKSNPVAELQTSLAGAILQEEVRTERLSARACFGGLLLLSALFWAFVLQMLEVVHL